MADGMLVAAAEEERFSRKKHDNSFPFHAIRFCLDSAGFTKQIAFKWGLRHHRKGLGHKEMPDLPAQEFPELSGEVPSEKPSDKWRHATAEVTGPVMQNLGPISRLYSLLHDRQKQRCDYYDSRGHEFFVIARKVMS